RSRLRSVLEAPGEPTELQVSPAAMALSVSIQRLAPLPSFPAARADVADSSRKLRPAQALEAHRSDLARARRPTNTHRIQIRTAIRSSVFLVAAAMALARAP